MYSLLVRAGLLERLASARLSDGGPLIIPERGRRAGVEHANNRGSVEKARLGTEGPPTHQAERKTQAPAIDARTNSAHYKRRKCGNSAM